MNNKYIITIAILLIAITTNAQTLFKGKVVDEQNKPLFGATIIYKEARTIGSVTDSEGSFMIKSPNGNVTISMMGYKKKQVLLVENKANIIKLIYESEGLEEIVVSASREAQKRKEVPASVGLLTAKQIEETKAFGIEQIVNQVPGVFMSTSKASGNEQHFMAVRSPISTRSLFLYLEDGLPIRPVAVFNHNALLEMNNTTFNRVEVLKGPASSIYGSEAIGGSFNFITKNPSEKLKGSIGFQVNDLGLTRYEAEASTTLNKKYGFYVGGHHARRDNGLIGHSDYEKTAITVKNVNDFSETLQWVNSATLIDYRSDMSGSLSEKNYSDGNYESNQSFTERVAKSFRFRSSLNKIWNDAHKTSMNFIYRNNEMNQIPSYRIRQNRVAGVLDGTGRGETNANKFQSYVGLIQHKMDFDFANSSLIVGTTADFSPQTYQAETIDVEVNTTTAQNIGYTIRNGEYILKYDADILNYAGYAQFEISPLKKVKFTGALRYDGFTYDYNNLDEGNSGVSDTKVTYNNIAPKLGLNFDISTNGGVYSNYSKGFTPPQIGTLFRNGRNSTGSVFSLKPSKFHNYEIGGYFMIPSKLKVDIALYQLDGIDRLISLRDDDGNFVQKNAGKTRSTGIELGVKYSILENLYLNYNGSYATHKYISFFENNIDYSNTAMQTAPNYIANTTLNYRPIKDLLLTLEHEQVGSYNTSFEGQAIVETDSNDDPIFGTTTYAGHHVFNFRANFTYRQFEIWGQALNVFDKLHAVRASYSRWARENTYSIGNPRAFHFGVKYKF
ncbi:Outer membrane receptor proteins, mostly Fe transport [Tenacibaculum sp. MAR_2009_124]|uniref:TonB-dependent receptor n=1 Tax=Tenacibaculum sp. MAR_2009_124 TaxID=1250059 RepID=UPI0008995572|nr:TonB-dependent receptor [Tenacibaculum sp. MAR_2009_124]SEC31261.1 Outer membrane receptor proteins, mostly Fe transport [Tenacibaculum sp. MAR_2009_124]